MRMPNDTHIRPLWRLCDRYAPLAGLAIAWEHRKAKPPGLCQAVWRAGLQSRLKTAMPVRLRHRCERKGCHQINEPGCLLRPSQPKRWQLRRICQAFCFHADQYICQVERISLSPPEMHGYSVLCQSIQPERFRFCLRKSVKRSSNVSPRVTHPKPVITNSTSVQI